MSIGVVVIEENFLIRWGLIAALQQDARLELYGSGFDARSALYGLERRPSVVLLGSGTGALSWLKETLRDVRTYFPRGPIVALSPQEVRSPSDAFAVAETADADVILLNPGIHPLDICRTVLQAAVTYQSRQNGADGDGHAWMLRRPPMVGLERLTPREWDVLKLLAKRWESQEIAEVLSISYSTVRSHLRSIYAKLGVSNRREAVSEAVRILRYWQGRSPQERNGSADAVDPTGCP